MRQRVPERAAVREPGEGVGAQELALPPQRIVVDGDEPRDHREEPEAHGRVPHRDGRVGIGVPRYHVGRVPADAGEACECDAVARTAIPRGDGHGHEVEQGDGDLVADEVVDDAHHRHARDGKPEDPARGNAQERRVDRLEQAHGLTRATA